jgi:hypothetical protein
VAVGAHVGTSVADDLGITVGTTVGDGIVGGVLVGITTGDDVGTTVGVVVPDGVVVLDVVVVLDGVDMPSVSPPPHPMSSVIASAHTSLRRIIASLPAPSLAPASARGCELVQGVYAHSRRALIGLTVNFGCRQQSRRRRHRASHSVVAWGALLSRCDDAERE